MIRKLHEIEKKFDAVEADFNDMGIVSNPKEMQRLGKLRSDLEPIVIAIREYRKKIGRAHV